MPKGNCGSQVSFHEGGAPGSRTWLGLASGTSPANLDADIRQVAATEDAIVRSAVLSTAKARWHGDRLHVTGEGGDLTELITVMIEAMTSALVPTEVGT